MRNLVLAIMVLFTFQLNQNPIQAAANQPIFQQINQIESLINKMQWDQALSESNQLQTWYKKNKWKLQLLGDEEEYEGMNRDINKLLNAIQEKDKTQSKLILANLYSLLKSVYTF